jgi:hypothetical protein
VLHALSAPHIRTSRIKMLLLMAETSKTVIATRPMFEPRHIQGSGIAKENGKYEMPRP